MAHYIDFKLSKVNAVIKQQNIERSKQERIEYFKQINGLTKQKQNDENGIKQI